MPKRHLARFLLGMLLLAGPASSLLSGCARADGVALLFEAERSAAVTDEAMERTRGAVERRLAGAGWSGATAARQGPNRILVTLDRGDQVERAKALIGRPARLEFRLVDQTLSPERVRSGQAGPGIQILPFPSDEPGGRIAVQRRALITGGMIADARAGPDAQGMPAIIVRFDEAGARRFSRVTQANVGRPFAIVIDGTVVSAPRILEPILGGEAQISGSFTAEAAEQLAIALRSGPLPVRLILVEERAAR